MRKFLAKITGCLFLIVIAIGCCGVDQAIGQDEMDPSGEYAGKLGRLSLMLGGKDLYLSYSAVFGAGVHICDLSGIARYVAPGKYHLTDEYGTVAITVDPGRIKMELIHGDASFCGAGWPGEDFIRDTSQHLISCQVMAPKAYFYNNYAEKRKAYVIKGDWVQCAATRHTEGDGWVLARFIGRKSATAGLMKENDVECR